MNKTALITGGSRGLGRSMALHLSDQGRNVIITYVKNEQDANEVVELIRKKKGQAIALRLDVTNFSSYENFVNQVNVHLKNWGREKLDFLINNAGHGIHANFDQTTDEQLDHLFAVHFKGPFLLTQKILPLLENGGAILNVSSGLARFSFPGYSAYASMKGAVETLTRYLAKELGPRKISVNTIAPGAIETDFGGGRVRDDKVLNAMLASQTSQGRVGLPDDIGGAVAMLLSDKAHWITGQRIEVSGGMML
ncbi:MAG: SDR family oxidoreductase [Bdellovibrionales bacterium]|nr:SDR family oxidoreductase [Bdellovibrionales bacterium]